MRLPILAAVLGVAAGGLAAAQDEAPRPGVYGDWAVECDNGLACTAIGFTANPGEEIGAHLYLTRGAAAGDAPRVEIGLGWSEVPQGLKDGDTVRVSVDGPSALAFDATIRRGPESYDAPELMFPPARRDAFLAAVTSGTRITLSHAGANFGTISLKGSSAALRWMDDRQRRAGGVTALVARGPRPASAVPAPPPLPVVRLAPPVSQAESTTRSASSFRSRISVASRRPSLSPAVPTEVTRAGSGRQAEGWGSRPWVAK